jgi:hypothetical protein
MAASRTAPLDIFKSGQKIDFDKRRIFESNIRPFL